MKRWFLWMLLLLSFSFAVCGQNKIRIVEYNVENYFDCTDDTLTNDDDFTPKGNRAWTPQRYIKKQMAIAKVIAALSEWQTPALIGLLEVENKKCLDDLLIHGPLKSFGYKYIHFDSPDRRGIDVALVYDERQFKPMKAEPLKVTMDNEPDFTTRDILYVKGVVGRKDTLHVYLCHFPSRWGGAGVSEPKRICAAQTLKQHYDSLCMAHKRPLVLIMGDFNDTPQNRSIYHILGAQPPQAAVFPNHLYNLMWQVYEKGGGTHKYQGEWSCLDQFIVSGAMLDPQSALTTSVDKITIFQPSFMLLEDVRYGGVQPFRTYRGWKYEGGYSDHLPVYLDLTIQ